MSKRYAPVCGSYVSCSQLMWPFSLGGAASSLQDDEILRAIHPHMNQKRQTGWHPGTNLDVFFTNMYSYFYDRGFAVILAKHVTNLMYVA